MTIHKKKIHPRAVPLISNSNRRLPISEQYRLIRTNIQFSSIDEEIQTIMVTSPEPGDGKSITTANLAVVLAQQDKRVLLVDTDLRRPTLHFTFITSNLIGLTNVLLKQISLTDAIIKTYIPNLDILTSGNIPPNPSELLSSKAMEILIELLKNEYDFVIFDTPPVLSVTDPQIVANRCDGVIMVVSSGKTTKESAVKAKELLEKAQSRILGVVINGVKAKKKNIYKQYFY